MIFVGVDWAEAHHDVFVQDEDGKRLAGGRLPRGSRASPDSTRWWDTMPRTPTRWPRLCV